MVGPVVIALERIARIQARIDSGSPLPEVLDAEALSLDAFVAARGAWLLRMSDVISANRFDMSQRYQAAYMAERPETVPPGREPTARSPAPQDDIDATALGHAIDLGAILPFVEAAGEAPPRIAPEPAHDNVGDTTSSTQRAQLEQDCGGDLDGTAFVATPFAGDAIPFGKGPTLTIEQYASLCAERLHDPIAADACYGIATNDARAKLDAQWRDRGAADPALRSRLEDLTQRYLSWLRQR
jgi:hypothetical protein